MKKIENFIKVLPLLICFAFCSCKITHNIPITMPPNAELNLDLSRVYVDQDGTFYPENFEQSYGKPPGKNKKYSLNLLAHTRNNLEDLHAYQKERLSELQVAVKSKNQIYILVHGYNNDEYEAKKAFDLIQEKIVKDKNNHFIEFYWDGLVGSGFGALRIWFFAAGYSQTAGQLALRKILNTLTDKDIFIIAHSRGASVVLSALSNPPYNLNFLAETEHENRINLTKTQNLLANGNTIKCVFFAPALGLVDFRDPENYHDKDVKEKGFRSFPDNVKSIHITVNKKDPILKKYIRPLSSKINPTDLGYNIIVFKQLETYYKNLRMTKVEGQNKHGFLEYINHPSFVNILEENGIKMDNSISNNH